jgi:hypothetical protein
MRTLFNSRAKDFRDLLDESRHVITPHSHWADVRDYLEQTGDERFSSFPERNRQTSFTQHIEFLGKKVNREFMQFMSDMGTQMTMQKIQTKNYAQPLEFTVAEVCEVLDGKDERFQRMGRFYPEERLAFVRQEVMTKK